MRMHYHKLTSQLADCEVSGQRNCWNFSAGYYAFATHSQQPSCCDIDSVQLADHAPPTYPYYDYSAVRDRRG